MPRLGVNMYLSQRLIQVHLIDYLRAHGRCNDDGSTLEFTVDPKPTEVKITE